VGHGPGDSRLHSKTSYLATSWSTRFLGYNKTNVIASDYEVVLYQPDLKDQVLELQTHLWSPSLALNRNYFEWKFERNPYMDKPLIYLAMLDGRAVGMRSFFDVKWEVGRPAQTFTCLYADDAVVTPSHRNHGVMPRIMTTALSDLANSSYDYVFNLSAGSMMFLTSISMGWRSAGGVQPMRRRTWQAAVPDRLHQVMKRLPTIFRKVDAFASGRSTRGPRTLTAMNEGRVGQSAKAVPGLSLQNVPRCSEMAELVERIGGSGRIRHVRDREYFDWRLQNPLSRYRFLFWDTDRLEGYLVLQEYTSEFALRNIVNIVDWEAGNSAIKAELLSAALKLVRDRNVNIWSATLTPETIELLVRNRFQFETSPPGILQQCPGILARATGDQKESSWLLGGLRVTDPANWDLRMLYSMCG
jgi:GNAT superfamily N-acetyltransferase